MPGFTVSLSEPVRERPASGYIATQPSRSRIESAVMNVSSSRWPRLTGNTPPCVNTVCSGGVNSCDFAMNRTFRRSAAPRKKWSRNEKWFGARRTAPCCGTFSSEIDRSRNAAFP